MPIQDDPFTWLSRQIPDPARKLLFLKCPRCGRRIWNCHGGEYAGYSFHYMGHIIDDMKEEE